MVFTIDDLDAVLIPEPVGFGCHDIIPASPKSHHIDYLSQLVFFTSRFKISRLVSIKESLKIL